MSNDNEWLRKLTEKDFDVPLAVKKQPKKRNAPLKISTKQQLAIRRQADGE